MVTTIEPFYRELGARIRTLREAAHLTGKSVGAPLGLTRASIANIEAGRQRILAHQLAVLAAVFGRSIAHLLEGIAYQVSAADLAERRREEHRQKRAELAIWHADERAKLRAEHRKRLAALGRHR